MRRFRFIRMSAMAIALGVGAVGTAALAADRAENEAANEAVVKDDASSERTTMKRGKKVKRAEKPVAADNTGINSRDRDDRAVTADQGKSNKTDVEVAAEIRRAIVKDKTLSMNAHNIKIIVQDGQVTLKGPVASKAEKANVEKKASDVLAPGSGKLTSEVDIAP